MTCIVTVCDDKGVLIGADGMSSNGSYKTAPTSPKLFCLGSTVAGFTWSHRVAQVCRKAGLVPHLVGDTPTYDEEWAVNQSEHWMKALREAKAIHLKEDVHGIGIGSMCLLACPGGRVWEFTGEGCVLEDSRRYNATGSGYSPAMGSLYSTDGLPTRDRVLTALYAATEMVPSVGPPYCLARVDMSGRVQVEENIP